MWCCNYTVTLRKSHFKCSKSQNIPPNTPKHQPSSHFNTPSEVPLVSREEGRFSAVKTYLISSIFCSRPKKRGNSPSLLRSLVINTAFRSPNLTAVDKATPILIELSFQQQKKSISVTLPVVASSITAFFPIPKIKFQILLWGPFRLA